jgi:hypothetical protein
MALRIGGSLRKENKVREVINIHDNLTDRKPIEIHGMNTPNHFQTANRACCGTFA